MTAIDLLAGPGERAKGDIFVRPLRKSDLAAADHIMRLAFGTFLGLPDPASFMGDAGYVRTGWKADAASTPRSPAQILPPIGALWDSSAR